MMSRFMDASLFAENRRLHETLQHYRNWSAQLLARFQMANADSARPPKRIYVGGLPTGTTEVKTACWICRSSDCCDVSTHIQSTPTSENICGRPAHWHNEGKACMMHL